jgi:Gpi18-like mannosyltransferase
MVGLAIRLPLLSTIGYAPDIAFWKSWLSFATTNGIHHVYALEMPGQTYPPVFLYLLWGLGNLYRFLWPNAEDSAWLTAFVKLPAVAADLVAAGLLACYARRRGGSPRAAAAMFALNPVLIWLSSYWGQVDVLHGGLAVAAWAAALGGLPIVAGALLALGVLVKPQGLLVLPAGAALLVRSCGRRGLARAAAAGGILTAAMLAPFVVSGYGRRLIDIYAGAGDVYPYVSVNAFNPWWCVSVLRPGGFHRALMSDAGLPRSLGLFLFAAATAWIVWRMIRRPAEGPRAWRLLTLQWLAFFLLATQVHERYLVPATLSFAPAVILDRRLLPLWLALTGAILLNILYIVPGSAAVATIVRIVSLNGILVALLLSGVAVLLVRKEIRE